MESSVESGRAVVTGERFIGGDPGRIIAATSPGKWQVNEIVERATPLTRKAVYNALQYLVRIGQARRLTYGVVEIGPAAQAGTEVEALREEAERLRAEAGLHARELALLAETCAAAEARADAAERVLAPVITYARQHPHLDGAEGEIGEFYGPALRVSISYRDLRAIRDYGAQTAGPVREGGATAGARTGGTESGDA